MSLVWEVRCWWTWEMFLGRPWISSGSFQCSCGIRLRNFHEAGARLFWSHFRSSFQISFNHIGHLFFHRDVFAVEKQMTTSNREIWFISERPSPSVDLHPCKFFLWDFKFAPNKLENSLVLLCFESMQGSTKSILPVLLWNFFAPIHIGLSLHAPKNNVFKMESLMFGGYHTSCD